MAEFYVSVGDETRFSKTVGESDIYQFAGITGDFAPMHIDEAFMAQSSFGHRIAHGVLIMGFMSATASKMIAQCPDLGLAETPVSLGYDRVRFTGAVFIGDTVSVTYKIVETDPARRRAYADIDVVNQKGERVALARHVLKWVPDG